MSETERKWSTASKRLAIVAVVAVLMVGAAAWWWLGRGKETTDDAQVDGHVTPIAARVGGTILNVSVKDNQIVEAGTVLIELDPRDFQIAVDRARAALDDAKATAMAAESSIPITSTTASGNISTAQGGVEQARGAVDAAAKEVDAAAARVAVAKARLREAEANAARAARDVDRLKGLLAKDEVSQQQYDAAAAAADAQRASVDAAKSQIVEAEAGIRMAESRRVQATAGEQQAQAALRTAQTAPEQVAAVRARALSAQAQVAQAEAALAQAALNLEYTVVKAPVGGVISRKGVNPGQVVQAGQPLLALVEIENVWITANFKETQLANMRPGQLADVEIDAYGGRTFQGKVESIAGATGARFSVLPPENATGNFVKVVQRVPVRIALDANQDPDHGLRPGMSAFPTVHTR